MTTLMTRGTWDPFAGLLADYGFQVPRYFEKQTEAFVPRFEVRETKDALILKADMPGVKSDNLDISVQANVLTISGNREQEAKTENETFHMVERLFGTFTRSFTLPEAVDTKHLEAELKEGVLTVILPKAPEAKPTRVQIKSGK